MRIYGIIHTMPAIKHHEILRDGDYFKGGALPCIVREMRDAPSNAKALASTNPHLFSICANRQGFFGAKKNLT